MKDRYGYDPQARDRYFDSRDNDDLERLYGDDEPEECDETE